MKRVKSGRAVRPAPEGDRSRRAAGARVRRVVLLALGLALVAGLLVFLGRSGTSARVYSVPDVQAGLRANPKAWAGRTILMRGWPTGYSLGCCIYLSSRPSINGEWPPTELTLALRPGASAMDVRRLTTIGPLRGVLNVLHNLGPLGAGPFRWSGSVTLRVRLSLPRPCAVQNSGGPNCSAGVLLGL